MPSTELPECDWMLRYLCQPVVEEVYLIKGLVSVHCGLNELMISKMSLGGQRDI